MYKKIHVIVIHFRYSLSNRIMSDSSLSIIFFLEHCDYTVIPFATFYIQTYKVGLYFIIWNSKYSLSDIVVSPQAFCHGVIPIVVKTRRRNRTDRLQINIINFFSLINSSLIIIVCLYYIYISVYTYSHFNLLVYRYVMMNSFKL